MFFTFFINVWLSLFLCGCNPFYGYTPDSDEIITKHWAKAKKQYMHKIYCYQTLGEHHCVKKPIKGKEHLLIGEHILTDQPYEKAFWERLNLHPILGVDSDTVKRELNVKVPKKNDPINIGY